MFGKMKILLIRQSYMRKRILAEVKWIFKD